MILPDENVGEPNKAVHLLRALQLLPIVRELLFATKSKPEMGEN
jgi:hypothetical protein